MTTNEATISRREVFYIHGGGESVARLVGASVEIPGYFEVLFRPGQAPRPLAFRLQTRVFHTEDITRYLKEPHMGRVRIMVKNWYAEEWYVLRLYDYASPQ